VTLIGRGTLVREVRAELAAGRSVLLFGPSGVGKTAVVAATATSAVTVLDPFERVTSMAACRIRRGMDHGQVFLAAACTSDRREIGHVGRILWRMRMMRVRALDPLEMRRLLERHLQGARVATQDLPVGWRHEAVAAADGLPGHLLMLADVAIDRRNRLGAWPAPGFALAMALHGQAVGHPI
jgi:hypothetical protein